MEIHNLMEDLVLKTVEEICNEESKTTEYEHPGSANRRMDIACFVLNRIPQYYVTSGRGMAHTERSINDNPQLRVDIVTLIHEGIKRVSSIERPYYAEDTTRDAPKGPAFPFPAFKGRFLNCMSFEPIIGVSVKLLHEGKLVPMLDGRWQNPFILDSKLEGTFLFLPRPVKAKTGGEKKIFEFEIEAEDDRYEPFHHFFKFQNVAENEPDSGSRKFLDFRLPDLFLIPK
jgi:competence protein ComFB